MIMDNVQRLTTSEEFAARISIYIDFKADGFSPTTKYRAFDTCNECDKTNCNMCNPVYEVCAMFFLPDQSTGYYTAIPLESYEFEDWKEALDFYNRLILKWIVKKGSC